MELNRGRPFSDFPEPTTKSYKTFCELDALGRCGPAVACIGPDLIPTEPRSPIGTVKPSGWHTANYHGLIEGNYLYNRCHLIAYELSGENANEKNLITGTRFLNTSGMLPLENRVAQYVQRTGHHVLYRVTPIFEGRNLVASGVLIEAMSVEDQGTGIQFNIYCYNVQPGIEINYQTGDSKIADSSPGSVPPSEPQTQPDGSSLLIPQGITYVLNVKTLRFHKTTCDSVLEMKEQNRQFSTDTRDVLIQNGFNPCGKCKP